MIIKTIDQIRAVLTNLAAEIEFADFETYINSAEDWIEKEILGSAIYTSLANEEEPDPKIIRLSHNVVILKAYQLGIPYMDLIQTASGFGVVKDSKRTPASKNRVDRLIQHNDKRLDIETEWLINHLEDNSEFHDNWKTSPAYSFLSDCLINTARQFARLTKFDGNRKDFLLLKPLLISHSKTYIASLISKDYLEELILKQNAATLSEEDNIVLPVIQQALANRVTGNENLSILLMTHATYGMELDLDKFPTYRDSPEKLANDNLGFENLADNTIFVFKGGM